MRLIKCEVCNGNELVKENGFFVCQYCGCRYAPDEAKKLMVEFSSPVEFVKGSGEMERLLEMADNCLQHGITDEARRLYMQVTKEFPTEWRGWWGIIKSDPKGEFDHSVNFENALTFAPEYSRNMILNYQRLCQKRATLLSLQDRIQSAHQSIAEKRNQICEIEKNLKEQKMLQKSGNIILTIVGLVFLISSLFLLFASNNIASNDIIIAVLLLSLSFGFILFMWKRNSKRTSESSYRKNSIANEIAQLQNTINTYVTEHQKIEKEIAMLEREQ